MPYVIAEPCIGVKDTACVDACPCDVIHRRREEDEFASAPQLYIEPTGCIDCACAPVCSVSASSPVDDLPEKWARSAQINRDWYDNRS